MVRRLWVNYKHPSWRGICWRHCFFNFLLPCKGQEAFSWGWPGPLDLECCSCASDSDWRFRFMPSKRQLESPKLVAITAEGNCKLGHKQRRFVTCKDTPAINEQNEKADTFQQILGSGVVRTSAENYAYWNAKFEIHLSMDLLCQDVFVSWLYLPLPAIPALEMCSEALHFIQPRRFKRMGTWSHFNSFFDFYLFPLWILWIVSRLNKKPFLPALVIQPPETFVILPYASKSRFKILNASGRKN